MSTLPRDSKNAADIEHQAPLMPVSRRPREFDEAVREFQAAAQWLALPQRSAAELRELCQQVAAFTAEVFPGEVAVVRRA